MSGVAGADRVKSRLDFKQFLSSYQHLLGQFPGFVSMTPSGSYNSNPDKQDFGDIDLIVHIQSDKDKATLKKELQAFFTRQPETVIVPFSSAKHAGKRTYNAGELVSVRYHDDALGYSAQIDNIVALDHLEATFKQAFLDMPAEEQGLVLGLVKIATIESAPAVLFQKLGIDAPTQLEADQEYEFNLSGVELQLRKVTYEPGTFKQLSRDIIWNSKNFDDVATLLYQYDLKAGFENLLQQTKQNIRNPRSNQRMQGVFSSMISVKSGEVGTAKGAGKEAALAKVQQAFGESRNKTLFRSLMENNNRKIVFAFGRFQPPTIGHELLINTVKQIAENAGAAHAIYVSKTQDHKTNPLAVDQKIAYLRKMFPATTFVAADATVRTPIEAAKHLNQTYNELIMVAGSDRASSFENLLNTYNGKDFNYQSIQVVSSGDRDPDSDEAAGMSGTKMREAAVANDLQTFLQGLPNSLSEDDAMKLMNLVRTGLTKPVKVKEEAESQLSVQQLATISDEALDNAYHYGRSSPGNTFGWQANLKSAAYAKQMIDKGITDIEAISDAIHKGWNVTAQAFVQNPDQFDDTEKLKAAGKLEAKLQQRAQLMKQNYAQLPDDEKEKDRVVARALLQAIKGQQDTEEDMSRRGFLRGAGALAVGSALAGGARADNQTDPNKLIAIVNIDGDSKEFNLTGRFKGDVKSQLHQAEDFITEFLEQRNINFSNLELRYQGAVLKTQNTGSIREEQGMAEGSRDDDEYGPKAREEWLKQQAYEKEYNKKKPSTPVKPANKNKEQGVAEGAPSGHAKLAMLKAQYNEILKSANPNMDRLRRIRDQIIKLKFDLGLSEGVAEAGSKAVANTASRLANKDDGKVAKLRAAGDKRREDQLKGRDIAKRDTTSKDDWGNLKEAVDPESDIYLESVIAELSNSVIEVLDDPWGPQGNFAGDKPVNVGGVYMKRIKIGDTVKYLGQKAEVVDMSKDGKHSRITILSNFGGTTKDVLTSDLKQLGQGFAEERMSAAVRLARAADRQRAKSDASLRRTPSSIPKPEPKKDEKVAEKIKGADGKACWDNYRYNGTENGKDKCVKVSEDIENIMESFINKIIINEAIQNNKR